MIYKLCWKVNWAESMRLVVGKYWYLVYCILPASCSVTNCCPRIGPGGPSPASTGNWTGERSPEGPVFSGHWGCRYVVTSQTFQQSCEQFRPQQKGQGSGRWIILNLIIKVCHDKTILAQRVWQCLQSNIVKSRVITVKFNWAGYCLALLSYFLRIPVSKKINYTSYFF